MTPFHLAIERLCAANDRLTVDRSDAAYAEWQQAIDAVRALHAPVEQRAVERARRGRLA